MRLRPATVTIHGSALRHNLEVVREYAPHSKVMPAIKADAYGHGVAEVAKATESVADGFAVATIQEALQIREQSIDLPILVFQGAQRLKDLEMAFIHQLRLVVHHQHQIELLAQYSVQKQHQLDVALKLDTGMHRLGIVSDDFPDALSRLESNDGVSQDMWLMTHFACADDDQDRLTTDQIQLFDQLTDQVHLSKTMANSAGIVEWPTSHRDWVRPGIMFYGGNPLLKKSSKELGLQAAMTLRAPILVIRHLKVGDAVGYGSTWRAKAPTRVGVVACGYADGYPRHAPTGTPVWVNGRFSQLLGRVSMDLVVIDLKDIEANAGDDVELWGENNPIDSVANYSETISYELMCHVGRLCHRIFEP
ncbi:MAG: Alanine racemase (EC [uncultured Thiotrichaceae bacterium]|uniref:Alanine racemase n=1 Tax=uncultured Thiotrichaceae bacterium TaxID=298394 RepID=A0A6S6ST17_9GAMM|nr:MAG: Alanine racemase (EC [uncultured Thiotrichaceae bacterium]